MKTRASQIIGKTAMLDVGLVIGQIENFKFERDTGIVYAIVIKPAEMKDDIKQMFRWEGNRIILPARTLKSIGDVVVFSKNEILMYKTI